MVHLYFAFAVAACLLQCQCYAYIARNGNVRARTAAKSKISSVFRSQSFALLYAQEGGLGVESIMKDARASVSPSLQDYNRALYGYAMNPDEEAKGKADAVWMAISQEDIVPDQTSVSDGAN